MALNVCQFNAAEAETLVKECFPNFEAFLRMKEKDISSISSVADDYSKRTNAQSRIIFGFYRTNELKGLMYWVQDMKKNEQGTPESPSFSLQMTFSLQWIIQTSVRNLSWQHGDIKQGSWSREAR